MFGRPLRTRLYLLRPDNVPVRENKNISDVKNRIVYAQSQQCRYYQSKRCVNFVPGETVLAKGYLYVKPVWIIGTIIRKAGNTIYYVKVRGSGMVWKRHANQLLKYNVAHSDIYLPKNDLPKNDLSKNILPEVNDVISDVSMHESTIADDDIMFDANSDVDTVSYDSDQESELTNEFPVTPGCADQFIC